MKANSKKLVHFIMVSLLLLTNILVATSSVTAAPARAKMDRQAFHDDMRKLWEDHITWTRLVIIGVFEDSPGLDPTVQRLLQNQVDIGDAIKPFYGNEAGEK